MCIRDRNVPDKKESGTIMKLVADAIWSNFSDHNPIMIPIELKINDPKSVKVIM